MSIVVDDADVVILKNLAQKYGLCTTPPNPGTSRPDLLFGYFGGGVVSEFSEHCNFLHIGSWGDWVSTQGRLDITNNFINQINAAVANGITKTMITMDWCLFHPNWTPLSGDAAFNYTNTFMNTLTTAGVAQYVHAIYTLDEPDVNGVSAAAVVNANTTIRNIAAFYPSLQKPLVTTYGVKGTPGIESFDWAGFDNYGTPIFTNGEFDAFVAKLGPHQKATIVPGGANPWRDNPTAFNAKAQADPRIALIFPFLWLDLTGQPGIRSNGMKSEYVAVGKPIKDANP